MWVLVLRWSGLETEPLGLVVETLGLVLDLQGEFREFLLIKTIEFSQYL